LPGSSTTSAPYGSCVQLGRHDVAVRVQRDHRPPLPKRWRTIRFVAEIMPFARTSASGTIGFYFRPRPRAILAPRVRGAVAGRIVARHLDEFGKKAALVGKVLVDESADRVASRVGSHGFMARNVRESR
jgi:hypothetical protein